MISIYDHFKNDIDERSKNIITKLYSHEMDDKLMKIMLMIIYGDKFEERNIVEFRGIIDLLKESEDPLKVLNFVDQLTRSEISLDDIQILDGENSGSWKKKILTEFVCEFYGHKGCTDYGSRISQSLIRVAATRIFSDPEQSIMELPVNSVDSYNMLEGRKSVGKFGMGFFSIFYWLTEPLNGDFKRKMTIKTRYYKDEGENRTMESYEVNLKWTNEGLLVVKNDLPKNFEFNGKEQTTGTEITLDFTEYPIKDSNVKLMYNYMNRLKLIEGATIYLNDEKLNKFTSDNIVNVYISREKVVISDNASGISFETLENSLLVPSSSTKKRDTIKDVYKSPIIEEHNEELVMSGKEEPSFIILVNGVAIVKIKLSGFDSYIITLPYNSKLPVSRDDILFTSYEIDYFDRSMIELIKMLLHRRNLIEIFEAFEEYITKNKSDFLTKLMKRYRKEIELSQYILLPYTEFWKKFLEKVDPSKLPYFIYYDRPNMFNTEKKLKKFLDPISHSNVFKLRKVIIFNSGRDSDTGELSEYLFVSDEFKNDLSKVALKENRMLLVPYNDNYQVNIYDSNFFKHFDIENSFKYYITPFSISLPKIFTDSERVVINNIRNGNFNQILTTLSLMKMCVLKKFENFDYYDEPNEYYFERLTSLICTFFVNNNIDVNEVIPYIIELNSKIMNFKLSILKIYGYKPYIQVISCSNLVDVNTNYGLNISCESYKKLFKDCVTCLIDVISSQKSTGKIQYPSFSKFLPVFLNGSLFGNINTDSFLKELWEVVDNTFYPVESFIILQILRVVGYNVSAPSYISNLQNKGIKLNISGLGMYLLSELRNKVTPLSLKYYLIEDVYGNNYLLLSKIINPMVEIGTSYINYLSSKLINRSINVVGIYKFTAKQLIEYVFNNKVGNNFDQVFGKLSLEFPTYKQKERKLQILEIAVNEGTTKDFIQSVLTELIQNSTDAIRSTGGNSNVNIYIGDNTISIKDNIGFENIINIMIPFLSSKNPNDPNVTGEMGSGFFNVYRQPFVKEVNITTSFKGKKRILKAEPLVENNNVYDIIYTIDYYDTNESDGTEVRLIFNNDLSMIASLVAEATIFTKFYLSFISGIILKLNDNLVQKEFYEVYEDYGIKTYIVKDTITNSYVMTNGIPLMPLGDFIKSLDNNKAMDYNLETIFNKYCQNSIIIDINKDIYTPTQARNKVQIKPTVDIKLMNESILNGFYYALNRIYIESVFSNMHEELFRNTSSSADPTQLKISKIDKYKSFLPLFPKNFTISEINYGSIKDLMDSYIERRDKPEDESNLPQFLSVLKWFSNKEFPTQTMFDDKGNITEDITKSVPPPPPVPFTILQPFSDIYWKKLLLLYERGILITNKFGRNRTPPRIMIGSIDFSTLAYYDPSTHQIVFNKLRFDPEELRKELLKFKGKDLSSITSSFIMNKVIKQYFSSSIPTPTLVHEFGHAIDNQAHNSSSHGITNIKIRNSGNLDFEDMASQVYQEAIGLGLINEFLETVV